MKFNSFSDEENCGKCVLRGKYELACLRTKGHGGNCMPEANKAGEADGVRWCCRVKLEQPHSNRCPLQRDTSP